MLMAIKTQVMLAWGHQKPSGSGKADVAKLVDVPDLGSGAARRVGSSPSIRTNYNDLRRKRCGACLKWNQRRGGVQQWAQTKKS